MRLLLPSRDSLDVVVSALFAHQVPARATHATVAAISGPTAAVISAGVVTFSSGRTPASGMGCPHVVGDRVLKVVVAHLAQLTEGLFLDLGLRLRRRPSGGLDEAVPAFVAVGAFALLHFPIPFPVSLRVAFPGRRCRNVKRTRNDHLCIENLINLGQEFLGLGNKPGCNTQQTMWA